MGTKNHKRYDNDRRKKEITPVPRISSKQCSWRIFFKRDAAKSALDNDTNNFANMDMFKWYALNDNVMGGVSSGNVTKNDANNLNFWGKLSGENRGGFASCRTDIETGVLSGYTGLSFMVRGDNRKYSALVTSEKSDSGEDYEFMFVAPTEWTKINIPFDKMYMSIMGHHPPVYPKITGDKVHKIGMIIADKNFADKFSIEVESITGFK